mmetsp:Transcript_88507/g.235096  ORF Transcript_88507/g.235096 Transcript_88507/m.235096 type:complete len:221 (-) Transcript_88507:187-849(-)
MAHVPESAVRHAEPAQHVVEVLDVKVLRAEQLRPHGVLRLKIDQHLRWLDDQLLLLAPGSPSSIDRLQLLFDAPRIDDEPAAREELGHEVDQLLREPTDLFVANGVGAGRQIAKGLSGERLHPAQHGLLVDGAVLPGAPLVLGPAVRLELVVVAQEIRHEHAVLSGDVEALHRVHHVKQGRGARPATRTHDEQPSVLAHVALGRVVERLQERAFQRADVE